MPNSTSARPTTTRELADLVKAEAVARHRMLIRGAGTAAGWGGPAERADTLIETTALTGVLRHDPEDMTVSVRAGTSLEELQTLLAEHGQRVSLDPARQALGATVGGLIATADSGPLRQAFGSLRTLVIGVTFVLADGTIARSGGHVIKNVAGYDLGKLLHGSLGTLGAVTEVVLRLHPAPRAVETVAVPAPAAEAVRTARALVRDAIEPVALEWSGDVLLVRLEGTPAGIEDGAKRVLATAGRGEVLSPSAAAAAWVEIAAISTGEAGDTVLRTGTGPRDSAWLADQATRLAGLHGVSMALSSSVGAGIHTLRLRGGDHAAVLKSLRENLSTRDGTCVVCRPDGLGTASTRGRPPAGAEVMRAIKSRFDPGSLLGAGRFAPWF
jgi:glycolate oxidase FAD binding subunit